MIKREISSSVDGGIYQFVPYKDMVLSIANTSATSLPATVSIYFRNLGGRPFTVAPTIPGSQPTLNPGTAFKDMYIWKDIVIPYGVTLKTENFYEIYADLMRNIAEEDADSGRTLYKVIVAVTAEKVQLLGYSVSSSTTVYEN
jgi:hypothetical protein